MHAGAGARAGLGSPVHAGGVRAAALLLGCLRKWELDRVGAEHLGGEHRIMYFIVYDQLPIVTTG